MAMSTVAPKRDKTTRFRRAPRDRSSRVLFYLAGAERSMGRASSTLWRALYVRDPEGHRRPNPAWKTPMPPRVGRPSRALFASAIARNSCSDARTGRSTFSRLTRLNGSAASSRDGATHDRASALTRIAKALGVPLADPFAYRTETPLTVIDVLALGWFFGVVSMFVALFGKE